MIICFGTTPAVQRSMTFDAFSIDGVNRTADVHQYASGKAVNAARVLQTLGERPMVMGFCGGEAGRFLTHDLDSVGVAHDMVKVDSNTRTCVTIVDRGHGTATELVEEAGPAAPKCYPLLLAKFESHVHKATAVLVAGSVPPSAPKKLYADAIRTAVDAGRFVLLDAAGEPLRLALASRPTVVKPNRKELEQTVGHPVDTDEALKDAIRKLLAEGPTWAIVTHGGGDTVVSDGKSFWKIASPTVAVLSPIGSGDAFAAGLLAGVARGEDVPEACKTAVACGAANAMTALAGHLKSHDVKRLVESVELQAF